MGFFDDIAAKYKLSPMASVKTTTPEIMPIGPAKPTGSLTESISGLLGIKTQATPKVPTTPREEVASFVEQSESAKKRETMIREIFSPIQTLAQSTIPGKLILAANETFRRARGKPTTLIAEEELAVRPITKTAIGIAGFASDITILRALLSPVAAGIMSRIPMATRSLHPTIARIASQVPVGTLAFGTRSAVMEAADQLEKGEFSPMKIVEETARGALFGGALGLSTAIPSSRWGITAAGGLLFGGWTAAERLIKNGALTKEDWIDIAMMTGIGMALSAIGSKQLESAYKRRWMSDVSTQMGVKSIQQSLGVNEQTAIRLLDIQNKANALAVETKDPIARSLYNKLRVATGEFRKEYVVTEPGKPTRLGGPYDLKALDLNKYLTPAEKVLLEQLNIYAGPTVRTPIVTPEQPAYVVELQRAIPRKVSDAIEFGPIRARVAQNVPIAIEVIQNAMRGINASPIRVDESLADIVLRYSKYGREIFGDVGLTIKPTPPGEEEMLQLADEIRKALPPKTTDFGKSVRQIALEKNPNLTESEMKKIVEMVGAVSEDKEAIPDALTLKPTVGIEEGIITPPAPERPAEAEIAPIPVIPEKTEIMRQFHEREDVKLRVKKPETELTTRVLQYLEGHDVVSKQFISDLTNMPELKQGERELIRETLKGFGDPIDAREFANKVKTELLELKRTEPTKTGFDTRTRYENISLPREQRGPVANYSEHIYRSPIETSAGNVHFFGAGIKDYFAHTRIEEMAPNYMPGKGKVERTIEIQSDLFQKGRLEREIESAAGMPPIIRPGREALEETIEFYKQHPKLMQSKRLKELQQLESYRNTWHERIIREDIKSAAQRGVDVKLYPTGETIMKIEGLGEAEGWDILPAGKSFEELSVQIGPRTFAAPRLTQLTPENIRIGQTITRENYVPDETEWIVTDILGDGKFKAVQKEGLEKMTDIIRGLPEKSQWQTLSIQDKLKAIDKISPDARRGIEETFDISGKIDTQNAQYIRYEKTFGRFLTNKYNAKRITDPQGVTWWEVAIKPEYATDPILAFRAMAEIEGRIGREITPAEEAKLRDINRKIFGDENLEIVGKVFSEEFERFIVKPGERPVGAYQNQMIKIVDGQADPTDTLYHESVHKYLDVFATAEERAAIMQDVVDRFKPKDLNEAEELLAENFIRYAKDREGFFGKVRTIIEAILQRIKAAIGHADEIGRFYNDLLRGVARGREARLKEVPTIGEQLRRASAAKIVKPEPEPKLTAAVQKIVKAAPEFPVISEAEEAALWFAVKPGDTRSLREYLGVPAGVKLVEVFGIPIEEPMAKAIFSLNADVPTGDRMHTASSGFHPALYGGRWAIVFNPGEFTDVMKVAAGKAGLAIKQRGHLTDVYLEDVGVDMPEAAKEAFDRFADLYERELRPVHNETIKTMLGPADPGPVEKLYGGFPKFRIADEVRRITGLEDGAEAKPMPGLPLAVLQKRALSNVAIGKIFKAARAPIIEQLRTGQREIETIRESIIDYAKHTIPIGLRGGLLNVVKNAKTQRSLTEAFIRIDRIAEKFEKKRMIRDIIDRTRKVAGSSKIAVDYKDRMNDLLDDVELRGHTEGFISRLRKTKAWLDRQKAEGQDVYLPEKTLRALKILERKPAADLTIEELTHIRDEIDMVERLGRTKQTAKEALYNFEKAEILEKIKSQGTYPINTADIIKPPIGGRLSFAQNIANHFRRTKNLANRLGKIIMPMDVWFDLLDGGRGTYDGQFYTQFKKRIDVSWGNYVNDKTGFVGAVNAKIAEYRLDETSMDKIGVWAALKQIGGREKLRNLGLTDEQIDAVVLDEREQKVYEMMRTKLDETRPLIAKFMSDVYNEKLGLVEEYFSFVTDFDALDDVEIFQRFGTVADELVGRFKKTVEKGFTKARVGAGKQKIKINAYEIFNEHMDNVAYMLNLGRDIKILGEIANSPKFKEIAGDFGQLQTLKWIDLLARKGGQEQAKRIRWLDTLRRNVSVGVLGLKLSSALIQPTALFDGAAFIGKYAFKGTWDIILHPDFREFLFENMPELRMRAGDDPAFIEMAESEAGRKVQRTAMWALKTLDKITATGIAGGAYQKKLAELGIPFDIENPNAEAIQYAQQILRRTQSSMFFKDVPPMIGRGELTGFRSIDRALTQFQTFLLNRWSWIRHDAIRVGLSGEYKQAATKLMWLTVVILAEIWIREKSRQVIDVVTDREREQRFTFSERFFMEAVDNVPFVSPIVDIFTYNADIPIPILRMITSMAKGISQLDAKTVGARTRGVVRALGSLGALFGIPGSIQLEEIIRGFLQEDRQGVAEGFPITPLLEDIGMSLPDLEEMEIPSLEDL